MTTTDRPPLNAHKLATERDRAVMLLRDICWNGTTMELDDKRYAAAKKFLQSIDAWEKP